MVFYDDRPLQSFTPRSIFLAGPTGRDVIRTPWRQNAIDLLSELRPEVLPEFRDRKFDRFFFERQPLGCYDELYRAIEHGDAQHQQWLRDKLREFFHIS